MAFEFAGLNDVTYSHPAVLRKCCGHRVARKPLKAAAVSRRLSADVGNNAMMAIGFHCVARPEVAVCGALASGRDLLTK